MRWLKRTAELAKSMIRKTDVPARFGGEEFIILMPETTKDGAYAAAEKIRTAIAAYSHPAVGTVTVSLGIAQRLPGESFVSLYKRLDDALYQAKHSGRNCAYIAPGS